MISVKKDQEPTILEQAYKQVFSEGTVRVNASGNTHTHAEFASKVVSMLNFLDRISLYEETYPGKKSHQMNYVAQAILQDLYKAKTYDTLDSFTASHLQGTLGLNDKEFATFFDEQGRVTDAFEQICRDVLRIGSTGGVSGKVYVDSKFYDDQFEQRAEAHGVDLVQTNHGVYTLT